ncbi:zinc ribbon domain-containing protein [Nitrosomonas sp. JL21]|uniref:zinc-ribbon domain-containing protein n=1 Tax=Nitrosomonas sp. JL21 TaxID=153949 RepID=UPI00136AF9A1|nr:zinc ribbon domain-containing protein [Nitrosomonas sp. JL21]MBL8497922.1 zinc ribbon domain-containing protein [Nitrosomonas sp.]MCC7091366.1 zinc ribbon domain-containing protein [Nitrosomonas sp.]MXS78263.1 zinc ribbon domain-containing protein [Nitrosomonas sp. JL21]
MRCPTCGAENPEGVQSCAQCHTSLPGDSSSRSNENFTPASAQGNSQQPEVPHPFDSGNESSQAKNTDPSDTHVKRVSQGVNIGIIIGTIFFPVIGVAMGYTYLKKDHPDERKAGRNWLILGVVMFIVNIMLISVLKR